MLVVSKSNLTADHTLVLLYKYRQLLSVLNIIIPWRGDGIPCIWTVVSRGSVSALLVLSSSSKDPGEAELGLSPIFIWACKEEIRKIRTVTNENNFFIRLVCKILYYLFMMIHSAPLKYSNFIVSLLNRIIPGTAWLLLTLSICTGVSPKSSILAPLL